MKDHFMNDPLSFFLGFLSCAIATSVFVLLFVVLVKVRKDPQLDIKLHREPLPDPVQKYEAEGWGDVAGKVPARDVEDFSIAPTEDVES